jgi:hypothetical protein
MGSASMQRTPARKGCLELGADSEKPWGLSPRGVSLIDVRTAPPPVAKGRPTGRGCAVAAGRPWLLGTTLDIMRPGAGARAPGRVSPSADTEAEGGAAALPVPGGQRRFIISRGPAADSSLPVKGHGRAVAKKERKSGTSGAAIRRQPKGNKSRRTVSDNRRLVRVQHGVVRVWWPGHAASWR